MKGTTPLALERTSRYSLLHRVCEPPGNSSQLDATPTTSAPPPQVFLLDDRLCYADGPGAAPDARYLPLDRVPVRPLPRGYGPRAGVTLLDARQAPRRARADVGGAFSVQCGRHTHLLAAASAEAAQARPPCARATVPSGTSAAHGACMGCVGADRGASCAQAWVRDITATCVHCMQHTGRGLALDLPGPPAVAGCSPDPGSDPESNADPGAAADRAPMPPHPAACCPGRGGLVGRSCMLYELPDEAAGAGCAEEEGYRVLHTLPDHACWERERAPYEHDLDLRCALRADGAAYAQGPAGGQGWRPAVGPADAAYDVHVITGECEVRGAAGRQRMPCRGPTVCARNRCAHLAGSRGRSPPHASAASCDRRQRGPMRTFRGNSKSRCAQGAAPGESLCVELLGAGGQRCSGTLRLVAAGSWHAPFQSGACDEFQARARRPACCAACRSTAQQGRRWRRKPPCASARVGARGAARSWAGVLGCRPDPQIECRQQAVSREGGDCAESGARFAARLHSCDLKHCHTLHAQVRCCELGSVAGVRVTRDGGLGPRPAAPRRWLLAEVRVRRAGAPAWQRFPAGLWLPPAHRCGRVHAAL